MKKTSLAVIALMLTLTVIVAILSFRIKTLPSSIVGNTIFKGDADDNSSLNEMGISAQSTTDYTVPPEITDFSSNYLYYTSSAVNLISNGDFEVTPSGSWNSAGFIDSGLLSVSTEKRRSGDRSLKFSANSDKVLSAVMWVDIEPNKNYVLSVSLLGEFMDESNLADMKLQLVNYRTQQPLDTKNDYLDGICPTRWDNDWHRRAVVFSSGDADRIGLLISGKHARGYIDDIMLCEFRFAVKSPQSHDKSVDPLLALADHKSISLIEDGAYSVSCNDSNNIIKNGDFSDEDVSFWSGILKNSSVGISSNGKYASNSVLKYQNTVPRNHLIMEYIEIKPDTEYVLYARIKGESEGRAAFTALSATAFTKPVRFASYTPEGFDGTWQHYFVRFNSNDDTRLGIGVFDGGGALLLDDIVLCEAEDAIVTKAPEDAFIIDFGDLIYPLGDINLDENVDASDLKNYRQYLLNISVPENGIETDINGDTKVDIRDLVHLKKQISGMIT